MSECFGGVSDSFFLDRNYPSSLGSPTLRGKPVSVQGEIHELVYPQRRAPYVLDETAYASGAGKGIGHSLARVSYRPIVSGVSSSSVELVSILRKR